MVSAGSFHTALLRNDGKLVVAGDVSALGNYNLTQVNKCGPFKQVSAGEKQTFCLTEAGDIVCLECHENGMGGFPQHVEDSNKEEDIKYMQVSAGSKHSVALRDNGEVIVVGMQHNDGKVETGETGGSPAAQNRGGRSLKSKAARPSVVTLPERAIQVSAGGSHTATLLQDGKVAAYGNNELGQCDLPTEAGFVQVSAGGAHTVLLRDDGHAIAFGCNDHQQCEIPQSEQYTQVSAGLRHTALVTKDGHVRAVGSNNNGQCDIPQLADGTTYLQASAGGHHTVLLGSDGQAFVAGVRGEVSVPSVYEKQSWADYAMMKPTLPQGKTYMVDSQELQMGQKLNAAP